MFKRFYPYEYVESVFSIDYNKLYDKGYRGQIFDIDNTLVHHGEDSTEEVDRLFKTMQDIGFKTVILSNNNEKRVRSFLSNIDSPYIYSAGKPDTANYIKSLEIMGISKEKAVVIGDQIFTDVLGANRSSMASILVKYMRKENESKIGKRRQLEKLVLWFYKKSRKFQKRIGDIEKEEVCNPSCH